MAGNELFPDVLGEVLSLAASEIAAELHDAVRAGVLIAASDSHGRARFVHDLYRETIYADLPTAARLALHQQVGAALEGRLSRGGTVFAGEVARHFAAAAAVDGPDRAIGWALKAAAAERARFAFAEAAAQLSRVRTALDDAGVAVTTDALVDLLVEQADAEGRAGDPDRARQLLRDAHTQALRLGDPERLAAVALGLQRLGARFAMPRDEVVVLLEEARRAVEGRAPAIEAQVTASLARELHHSIPKDRARARPLSEHAVAIARDLDDPATLAACLLARHDVLWTPGAAAERVHVAREIVALATRVGDDERRSEGHLLKANALLESGSPAFRTELEAFLRLEGLLGQPRHDYLGLTRSAAMALLDGSLDLGERLVYDAAELGERIGEPDTGNVRMSQLLEVARARGEPSQLRATAKMAVAWWVGVPSHAHAVAAGLFAQAGDLDEARRALDTVVELGTWREDRSYLWSVFVGGLTLAAARLGELDLSRELLDELGLIGVAARVGAGARSVDARCHHDGDVWNIAYRDRSVVLRDAKGLHDLAVLLVHPGENIHVLDLAASALSGRDSTGPVLDARARADFRRRIAELDEDFAEAQADHDLGTIERVETERAALLAELSRATGSAGRDRGLGTSTAQRARKAVTARLRDTIRRIAAEIPDLGTHLDSSILTGNYCRYEPTEPLTWDVSTRPKP